MDLVVNGPLKASIRRHRARNLFDYFQQWKIRRLSAGAAGNTLPPFSPPKPKLADGIIALLDALRTTLSTESFKHSMCRTFVRVGLLPQPSSNTFVEYKCHKKLGSLCMLPSTEKALVSELDGSDPQTSFGEVVAEVDVLTRAGEAANEECVDADEESDDSDDDEAE